MNDFYFIISKEAEDLGLKAQAVLIKGINNRNYSEDFDEHKKSQLELIKQYNGPILDGFRKLHKETPSSPETLLNSFLARGRFPKISPVVDIYNLVSIKSKLAFGAHDLDKLVRGVTLKIADGSELFTPLGKNEKQKVSPGEYCYVDEFNKVICRLEVLQCEETKVMPETKNILLFAEGNEFTSDEYLKSALTEATGLIIEYCGGEAKYL